MANQIRVVLSCNGRTLTFGKDSDIDITKITGLESSDIEISKSDNALVDGETVDGIKIKGRPIHIEASFRDLKNNKENRQNLIKFFNPKYAGKALIEYMGVSRNIEYRLEGWTFKAKASLDVRLAIVVDLYCPDPYMLNIDNFGKNMAAYTPLFGFPWMKTAKKVSGLKRLYSGCAIGGFTFGYRTLHKEVALSNDGDVSTGVIIKFVATRGEVSNPKIINVRTGQFMRVKVEMAKGDVLVIDTNERHQIVELNGVNCYQRVDRRSEPFQLAVGENYLGYEADKNYVNLDVNLYYTPKYLGV